MLNGTMWTAFLVASLLLSITPGPGVLFIVTRTLSQGRKAGLASVGGVALGNLGNALGASIGLAALFAVSSTAFTVVKLIGAGYLFYLGIKALKTVPMANQTLEPAAANLKQVFKEGFWVALLNPKTTIFFSAFLPQFIDPGAPLLAQSALLGGLFVLIAASTDSAYALAAGQLAPAMRLLSKKASVGRYLSASIYMGLGLMTAFAGHRNAK